MVRVREPLSADSWSANLTNYVSEVEVQQMKKVVGIIEDSYGNH